MAKGIIDKGGNVTIAWNSQVEVLEAPGNKHYLPCESCGDVKAVEMNVVSFLCDPCKELQGTCEDCGKPCRPENAWCSGCFEARKQRQQAEQTITGQCEECGADVTGDRRFCEACNDSEYPSGQGVDIHA